MRSSLTNTARTLRAPQLNPQASVSNRLDEGRANTPDLIQRKNQ
jgi:hypothetical protein